MMAAPILDTAGPLEAALDYAARGWQVLPLHSMRDGVCSCGNPSREKGHKPGKHPRTAHGSKDATTDPEVIRAWWNRWPDANVGIATGAVSGIVVLDIDVKDGGDVELARLVDEHGDLPATAGVHTGGGGGHFYFRHPGGRVANSTSKIAKGIDVRGDGGYVVAPPSLHESGRRYEWVTGEVEPATLPAWLLAAMQAKAPKKKQATAPASDAEVRKADRDRLLSALGRHGGKPVEELLPIARELNGQLSHPRDEDDLASIVEDAARWEPRFESTQLGNGARFAYLNKGTALYCPDWKTWLFPRDGVWVADKLEADRRAKAAVASILEDAGRAAAKGRDDTAKGLTEWWRKSNSVAQLDAMLRAAQSEPGMAVRPEDFDADPLLLGCANGAINLRTGALLPHDPARLLTKSTGIKYDPAAKCPRWEQFMEEFTGGNLEVIGLLQRWMGYTLTADVSEQKVLFLHGAGANGKSVLVTIWMDLLGDYGGVGRMDFLLAGREAPGHEKARLVGRRLMAYSEVEEGRKFNEALIKEITSSEPIEAKRLYENPFDFKPTHKIVITGNHRPAVRGTDNGIWRRLVLVPCEQSFLGREDPHLLDALRAELPGILNWSLEGLAAWKERGLDVPAVVREATEDYRKSEDTVGAFIAEECEERAGFTAPRRQLRTRYEEFCKEMGHTPVGGKAWGKVLEGKGFSIGADPEKRGMRVWKGLRLKPTLAAEVEPLPARRVMS